jgi:hypothetical protein
MPQPSITVRAMAELLEAPLYTYDLILSEQKHPKGGAATYKVPYYASALAAIRRYFKQGRSGAVIQQAIADIKASGMKQQHRIDNNVRALESFSKYKKHKRREIIPAGRETIEADFSGVMLRFSADLAGTENGEDVFILYNPRNDPVEPPIAQATLELAHWVLQRNSIAVPMGRLAYVDLFTRETHKFAKVRPVTIQHARGNAKVVVQRWPML